MPVQKIKSGRVLSPGVNDYVGSKGQIFYDEDLGELRLSNGITPGGISITSGGGGTGSTGISEINTANSLTNTVTNVTTFRFDKDTGFNVTDLGSGVAKIGLTPINIIGGTGVTIDSNTATNSVTISSSVAASANLIKTFNILNNFQAPLIGTSIFVPTYTDDVRGVVMVNATPVGTDLTVGLYRNGELLNFFTLTAGNFKAVFSGFEYRITSSDYITVNVVSGQGLNFNLALLNSSPT